MTARALTPAQKRAVIERILAAWEKVPELRLSQLIANAVHPSDGYYHEDELLAECVEAYAYPRRVKEAGK